MLIKNKRTHVERYVTQEGWAKIISNTHLRSLFVVIDRSDIEEMLTKKDDKKIIVPEEILKFRSLKKSKKSKKHE